MPVLSYSWMYIVAVEKSLYSSEVYLDPSWVPYKWEAQTEEKWG